jgi:uncharacterized surface protein with fasciclin (FAS1) repeats
MKHKVALAALLAAMGLSTSAFADNLLEVMDTDGGFKTMLAAIKKAGLEDQFKAAGPMTVFAPTDFAFQAMPKDKLDKLMNDKEALKKVLLLHVVNAKVSKTDVDAGKVKTMEGESVSLSVSEGIKIDNVPVVGQGINADNGVIHAMTAVLLPKS